MSGMDVFVHVCGQKADTSSNYCDNIQLHDKRQIWHNFYIVFFWKLPQIRTSNFRKVVRQHTQGMVISIIRVLLAIYFSFQQWKNFENPLRINKVIAMSLVYYVFGSQCTYLTITRAVASIKCPGSTPPFNAQVQALKRG